MPTNRPIISETKITKSQFYSAFTLAEVLITLGIIGVIAAMVLPPLINNIQDMQFKTAWKKEYSTFANATNTILNENGGTLVGLITGDDNTLSGLYEQHLKIVKQCERHDTVGKCWPTNSNWKYLNTSTIAAPTITTQIACMTGCLPAGDILADGTLVRYLSHDCNIAGVCGYILIDVNGFKNPNTIGRDIFGMLLYHNKLVPIGSKDTAFDENTCSTSNNGLSCSSDYLYQ